MNADAAREPRYSAAVNTILQLHAISFFPRSVRPRRTAVRRSGQAVAGERATSNPFGACYARSIGPHSLRSPTPSALDISTTPVSGVSSLFRGSGTKQNVADSQPFAALAYTYVLHLRQRESLLLAADGLYIIKIRLKRATAPAGPLCFIIIPVGPSAFPGSPTNASVNADTRGRWFFAKTARRRVPEWNRRALLEN